MSSWLRRVRTVPVGAAVAMALTVVGCAPTAPPPPPPPPPSPTACNGADALCAKPYDSVAYLTTHNAMAAEAYGFLAPNQTGSFSAQLDAGVRALMLDVHRNGDSPLPAADKPADAILLCHGYCAFGRLELEAGLAQIRSWLDAHPREVLTLILENYVSAAALDDAFDTAGLTPMLATHTTGAAWPTLQEMIASGDRVVVLTDSRAGERPWLLPVFGEAWETNYSAQTSADLSCAVNRGSTSNRLIILNNFLTNPVASPFLADQVNTNPFLADRIATCRSAWGGRLPNFVTVDFFERGAVSHEVSRLNGL